MEEEGGLSSLLRDRVERDESEMFFSSLVLSDEFFYCCGRKRRRRRRFMGVGGSF
jgi:hypothetical protein